MKRPPMSSFKEFSRVYLLVEGLGGRKASQLDVERAYKRLLKITGETPLAIDIPSTPRGGIESAASRRGVSSVRR